MPLADVSGVPIEKRFLFRGVPIPPSSLSKSNGGFRPFSSLAKLSFSTLRQYLLLRLGRPECQINNDYLTAIRATFVSERYRKQDKSLENDFTKRSVADADRANNSIPPDNEAEERSEVDCTDVRVRSFRHNVGEACGNTSSSLVVTLARGKRESERKGNPPINTGQSPNSDDRANNKVELVNELARGSGSLQKMKA
ncbi:hypothetical protein T12_15827 [Trichinella patagoniensis]|uniref:Uncharacterized protein n=1 Tax=Trichinella patagoniensis TaxID=990121 RepID=A0A0V1A8K4_9BILA|nr:hypothetical protein T12_15827 [Trichinella patagoniensis]